MKAFLYNDWQDLLAQEFAQGYYQDLRRFLAHAYQNGPVYPPMDAIYNALHATSYADTKVVILGQDPYHGPGQAHGLSFSVQKGVSKPPSLQNIFKELQDDIGCPIPQDGLLTGWAEQGVLLLNTTLTVAQGQPKSHAGKGWETLTDKVISLLSQREAPVVFILWGAHAQSKRKLIDNKRHPVLKSPHPSPLSAHRGFFGSKVFSKTNNYLVQLGQNPIQWCHTKSNKEV